MQNAFQFPTIPRTPLCSACAHRPSTGVGRCRQRGKRAAWSLIGLAVLTFAPGAGAQNGPGEADRADLERGAAAMKAGDLPAAIAAYRSVTAHLPEFAEGYLNLGLALEQQGLLDEASAPLKKAAHLKPALKGVNLFLGVIAYRQNRLKDAEAYFERESRLDPQNAKAYMWMGVCRLAGDDPHGAIAPLDKAYLIDSKDVDILYHRGRAYFLVANESYAAMSALSRNSARVHQVLAESFVIADSRQKAIEEFETAIRLAPRQPGLHEELGNQYWIAGEVEKAAAAYQSELKVDPYASVARYKLGCLLIRSQKASEGMEVLRAALRQDPSLNDAHYYLGVALMDEGDDDEAIRELDRAVASDPESDRAMSANYKLAQIYRKQHQPAKAQAAMESFLRLRAQSRLRQPVANKRSALPVADPEEAMPSPGPAAP